MVNFVDVANGDIFKGSITLANILDITPEYAKENQKDEKKLLYFIEILNAIGRRYEKLSDFPGLRQNCEIYDSLVKLLNDVNYYGLNITAHYNGTNQIVSLKLDYSNDLNPLMCLDMAIHLILDKAGFGIFDFKRMEEFIRRDATPELLKAKIVNMLITGELFVASYSLYEYKVFSKCIADLMSFVSEFCKIPDNEFSTNNLVNKSINDALLVIRAYIINTLKIRLENNADFYFVEEMEKTYRSCEHIINNALYSVEDDKFIESIVSVLNKVYEENFDKVSDIKFTVEDAKVSLGLLTKNYLIREKIREVYLGIKPNNLYDNFE